MRLCVSVPGSESLSCSRIPLPFIVCTLYTVLYNTHTVHMPWSAWGTGKFWQNFFSYFLIFNLVAIQLFERNSAVRFESNFFVCSLESHAFPVRSAIGVLANKDKSPGSAQSRVRRTSVKECECAPLISPVRVMRHLNRRHWSSLNCANAKLIK